MGGENLYPIQPWIDSVDGKYAPIIIAACNGEGNEIHSKKSNLYVPSGLAPLNPLAEAVIFPKVEPFVPGLGYLGDVGVDHVDPEVAYDYANHIAQGIRKGLSGRTY
jgi:hypothetical protein